MYNSLLKTYRVQIYATTGKCIISKVQMFSPLEGMWMSKQLNRHTGTQGWKRGHPQLLIRNPGPQSESWNVTLQSNRLSIFVMQRQDDIHLNKNVFLNYKHEMTWGVLLACMCHVSGFRLWLIKVTFQQWHSSTWQWHRSWWWTDSLWSDRTLIFLMSHVLNDSGSSGHIIVLLSAGCCICSICHQWGKKRQLSLFGSTTALEPEPLTVL